jgi:hypothetical protein
MEREIVLESAEAALFYYPRFGIVHHEIRAHLHGEAFRRLLLLGSDVFLRHRATKWLSDDRGNAPLSREDGVWTQDVWLPPVLEAGWKHWAMVPPTSEAGERNIRVFTDMMAALGLSVRVLSDPAEALAWLQAA